MTSHLFVIFQHVWGFFFFVLLFLLIYISGAKQVWQENIHRRYLIPDNKFVLRLYTRSTQRIYYDAMMRELWHIFLLGLRKSDDRRT